VVINLTNFFSGTNDSEIIAHQGSTTTNAIAVPGEADIFIFHGTVRNVSISLGGGNDTLSVFTSTLSGGLSITGGGGNDQVYLGAIAPSQQAGFITTSNAVSIGGNLSIALGGGSDSVNFGTPGDTSTDVTVGGNLSICLGNGADTINEILTSVADSESIQAGNGTDFVGVGNVAPGNTLPNADDTLVTVGGTLSVNLGNGSDNVFVGNSEGAGETDVDTGSALIQLGSGGNSVSLGFVNVAKNLSVVDGNGNDRFDSYDVTVGGSLAVAMGNGNDSIIADSTSPVKGSATFALGNGNDFLAYYIFNVGGSLSITLGNGDDAVSQIDSTIGGAESIVTGCGVPNASDDTIVLNNVTAQSANISTGPRAAADVVVEDSSFTSLSVTLGAGAGNLTVQNDTTTHSTNFVGQGKKNTYTDEGGNSFAKLVKSGLTNTP
jgi:large repetitive protein